MIWFYMVKLKNEIKSMFVHYTLPLLSGLMIDWKTDNSYGSEAVWYTYTNLYLYLQYNHFEIIQYMLNISIQ